MMRFIAVAVAVLAAFGTARAESIEVDGLRADVPADWKSLQPTNSMQNYRFKLPAGSELTVFVFGGGAGTVEQNFQRQRVNFKDAQEETTKYKIAGVESPCLDIRGTFLSKFPPFAPNAKITEKPNYRELYAVYEKGGKQTYFKVMGTADEVGKDKDAFDAVLKSLK